MSPIGKEILSNDIGLLSITVVAITIGIIGYIGYMLMAKSKRR